MNYKEKLKTFIISSASSNSFNFDFMYQSVQKKVLVLLARVREKSHKGKQDLIVIDIKSDQST